MGATLAQLEEGTRYLQKAPRSSGSEMLHPFRGPAGFGETMRMTKFYVPVLPSDARCIGLRGLTLGSNPL